MNQESGDELVLCPYDNTHLVSARSLSKHLIKCRENHKGHRKVVCKFNKTHLVPKPELHHHLSVCPDRCLLDRELQLKAAGDTVGVLLGDVQGPEIVTQYMGNDEEDWDSAPQKGAPIALFNRKEQDSNKDFVITETPTVPGANYVTQQSKITSGPVEEMAYRKIPLTSSKVAQMSRINAQMNTGKTQLSEVSTHSTTTGPSNQVYLYSLGQAGWGRGKGGDAPQVLQTVGVVQPLSHYPAQPTESVLSAEDEDDNQLPIAPTDRYSLYNSQLPQQSSGYLDTVQTLQQSPSRPASACSYLDFSDEDETSVPRVSSGLERLPDHGSAVSSDSVGQRSKKAHPVVASGGRQPGLLNIASLPEVPHIPKGRGYFNNPGSVSRGRNIIPDETEQLRLPTGVSLVSSAFSSRLSSSSTAGRNNFGQTAASSAGKAGSTCSQMDVSDIEDDGSSDIHYSALNIEDLRKVQRKLQKKMRQIEILEQKLLQGTVVTEEERFKLHKKEDISNLLQKISSLLNESNPGHAHGPQRK